MFACAVLSVCWPILIVRIQWLIKGHQEVRELQKDDLDHICRFIYTYTHTHYTHIQVYKKCTRSLCLNVFQAYDYEKKKLLATKGDQKLDLLI